MTHPQGETRSRWAVAALTVGGLGLLRPGPGTWGSMPPVALAIVLVMLSESAVIINAALIILGSFFALACILFAAKGEAHFGRKDASEIVADEVAGQCIALLLLPWRFDDAPGSLNWNLLLCGMAFASFRAFDILKPPPIFQVQKLPAGWGVLMDDVLAGLFALAIMQLLSRIILA